MLVLSRKVNEVVLIGEGENQIKVMVCEIRGDRVRLAFQADSSVKIHRQEVVERIAVEGERSDANMAPS